MRRDIVLYVVGAGVLVSFLTHPFCSLLFGCGCAAPFFGGATACALMPGMVPLNHQCPWCAMQLSSLVIHLLPTVAISALAGDFFHRRLPFHLAVLGFMLACMSMLLITGVFTGLSVDFRPSTEAYSLCGAVF